MQNNQDIEPVHSDNGKWYKVLCEVLLGNTQISKTQFLSCGS